ncbi:MAG: GAF domain-containing sensor histidine kinase [Chloroflexi bacterium]|nr:GAF domain-containing sensor histidine kinase [Chloroflexota bacterium]
MVGAIDFSNDINALNQRLRLANERLTALYESTQTITSTLELNQVLERLAQSTAHVMNVEACSIRMLDETGTRLKLVASHGLSENYLQQGLVLESEDLLRRVLAEETINIGDATQDARWAYPSQAETEGLHSILIAPLIGKKDALGLVLAVSHQPYHFVDDDAKFLVAIGRQGGIAIENALAFEALAKNEESKSKFVRTVTHELRSPVSTIRSLLRTFAEGYLGELTDTQRDTIERILRRADFLQMLIDDLLDLAAGKSDSLMHEANTHVQLDAIIERVIKRLQIDAREKKIELTCLSVRHDQDAIVLAAEEGMERVLGNLVSNAIKYTPRGGRVFVSLSSGEGVARIDVSDSGIGIPEESFPYLFDEFYRAPNARALVKQGTGLGLAITKDIVTRYGGQMSVRSQLNAGTTFTVTFPIVSQ